MKKFLSIAAVAALCMSVFTACDDDDFTPQPQPVYVTDGVFVVNESVREIPSREFSESTWLENISLSLCFNASS